MPIFQFECLILVAALVWLSLLAHELAHLLAARHFGVRVLTITLGVGPEIGGFSDRLGTRWSIAAIPLASYMTMLGDIGSSPPAVGSPKGVSDGETCSLSTRTLGQRAAIYGAGAAANILLAPVIYGLGQLLFVGALAWPNAGDPDSGLALIFGLYSLSVGLLHLLPLPLFDGDKLMRLGVDWLRRRTVHALGV
jgi:membrane-associated protease RseP (regulator of RpoE activity)